MRPLYQIAEDILADWERPDYTAAPYIEAMLSLDSMSDKYILDDADDIVLRFLTNAGKWRGPVAREIKKELNKMLKAHNRSRRASMASRVAQKKLAAASNVPVKSIVAPVAREARDDPAKWSTSKIQRMLRELLKPRDYPSHLFPSTRADVALADRQDEIDYLVRVLESRGIK